MEALKAIYVYPLFPDKIVETTIYPLTKEGIDSNIPDDIIHGNYRIGIFEPETGDLYVKYIGRADNGLKNRVPDHLPDFIAELIKNHPGRVYFSFNSELDELSSYHHECRDYHDFVPDFNDYHPAKPEYTPTHHAKFAENKQHVHPLPSPPHRLTTSYVPTSRRSHLLM